VNGVIRSTNKLDFNISERADCTSCREGSKLTLSWTAIPILGPHVVILDVCGNDRFKGSSELCSL
jgi:hypothetical protein